jgi:hypothetical protein
MNLPGQALHALEVPLQQQKGRLRISRCRARAGAWLRVVRVDGPDLAVLAYGEGAYTNDAIRIAAEDFQAGHREYSSVYGKIEPEIALGAVDAQDELDAWILKGNRLEAYLGVIFVVELVECLEGRRVRTGASDSIEQAIVRAFSATPANVPVAR